MSLDLYFNEIDKALRRECMIRVELLNEVRNLPVRDRIALMESTLSSVREGLDVSPDRGAENIKSVKTRLRQLLREYKGLKPYENIDPLQWEREIRNEWPDRMKYYG